MIQHTLDNLEPVPAAELFSAAAVLLRVVGVAMTSRQAIPVTRRDFIANACRVAGIPLPRACYLADVAEATAWPTQVGRAFFYIVKRERVGA